MEIRFAFRPPVDWYSPASWAIPSSTSVRTHCRTVGMLIPSSLLISCFDVTP